MISFQFDKIHFAFFFTKCFLSKRHLLLWLCCICYYQQDLAQSSLSVIDNGLSMVVGVEKERRISSNKNKTSPILFEDAIAKAKKYGQLYPDSGLVLAERAYEIALTNQNTNQQIEALTNRSQFEFWNLKYEPSWHTAEKADSLYQLHPNEHLLLPLLYRLAESYEFTNRHDLATKYYSQSYDVAQMQNDVLMLSRLDIKMGDMELMTNNNKKASIYYQKALERVDKNNPLHLKAYYAALKEVYQISLYQESYAQDDLNLMFEDIQSILPTLQSNSEFSMLVIPFYDLMVKCALRNENKDILKSVKTPNLKTIQNQTSNQNTLQGRLYLYGTLAFEQGDYKKANLFAQESWDIAKNNLNLDMQIKALDLNIKLHKLGNNHKAALNHLELKHGWEQDLAKQERVNYISQLQEEYATKEKELTIQFLQSRNQLQTLLSISFALLGIVAISFFLKTRSKNKIISKQNTQLEELNSTKDRIFAIISHDLRKPAISFRGIAKKVNYLLKKQDFETLNDLGNEIERDALALNKLTDNLLNWSLTQQDLLPYNPELFDLSDKVDESLLLFANKAKAKKIDLVDNINSPLQVYADPNAVRSIIRNLIDNAIKYTPAQGKIEISATQDEKNVYIQVADSGLGMSTNQVDNIFKQKRNKSTLGTNGEEGTGLGLQLVNDFIKINNGAIKVVSELGKGTTFNISLPLKG